MAEHNNVTCSICGRPYHLCLSCKDTISLSPWRHHTDTPEHYKIYQIIKGFNTRVYTKEEAKLKLQMVDLSDFDSLRDNIKNIIKDIMGENNTEIEVVVETPNEAEISNKPRISRKRKLEKIMEQND